MLSSPFSLFFLVAINIIVSLLPVLDYSCPCGAWVGRDPKRLPQDGEMMKNGRGLLMELELVEHVLIRKYGIPENKALILAAKYFGKPGMHLQGEQREKQVLVFESG